VLGAISGGAGGSWYLSNLGPRILDGDFAPGFTVDLQQKDLRLVLGAAADVRLPLPGVSLVHQLFNLVQRLGCGGDGVQALIKAYERPAGIEVRSRG
jgi:3-hydroxyisobutyrate dehydrogenase